MDFSARDNTGRWRVLWLNPNGSVEWAWADNESTEAEESADADVAWHEGNAADVSLTDGLDMTWESGYQYWVFARVKEFYWSLLKHLN